MFPLVEFPELVRHYAAYFESVFSSEALVEFERYVSGLLVSENKTVDGINRLMVCESRNQSSLNRFLTASPLELAALNAARLQMLAARPETQVKRQGVLSVDDTLLKHYGHHFEKIAYLWDHVTQTYVWAHNLVTVHYSDDQTDYPLAFQLWEPADLARIEQGLVATGIKLRSGKLALKADPKQEAAWRKYLLGVWQRHQGQPEVAALYASKLSIAKALLRDWVETHPRLKLPVTFDSWYTQPEFCRYLDQTLDLPYVGTLDDDARLVLKTGMVRVDDFAERLKQEHLTAVAHGKTPVFERVSLTYKGAHEVYYSYCATHRVHNFGKVRLVINYRQADLSGSPVYYIANRLVWQAAGITRIRRHRWPVEVYYEEGKAEGLDQSQLRDFGAIEKHVALVAVVYSLLRAAQHDPVLQQRLHRELKVDLEGSVAFWRRVTQAQSLWSLALFISAGLAQGQTLPHLMAPLLKAVCAAQK
jgi:hypothetical protein